MEGIKWHELFVDARPLEVRLTEYIKTRIAELEELKSSAIETNQPLWRERLDGSIQELMRLSTQLH